MVLSRGVMLYSRDTDTGLVLMMSSSGCLVSARGAARWLHVQGGLEGLGGPRCAHDNIFVRVGSALDRDLRLLAIILSYNRNKIMETSKHHNIQ